tara:strand:- start:414 stop:557 length:144 start_codon:yes stop_codon:yes gene_type:complete
MGETARIILGGFILIGFFFLVGLEFMGWLTVVVMAIMLLIMASGKAD